MIEPAHNLLDGLGQVGELASRCSCDRPTLIADQDGAHCMKCGRPPGIPRGATSRSPEGSLFVRELPHG